MTAAAHWTLEQGVAHIASILGPEHVRLGAASVVAIPGSLEQIAAVLRLAQENGLSVTPRGGGTKQDWGNPVNRAIELSLERLHRLQEHAWPDLTCRAEAGLCWQTMQAELARHGQMVALDPLWPEQATIGGIVAANDSGAMRFRYGSLRDLILGMTVVLADGTIARSGGKVVKNVAGYDLHKLMTGSFGTLAVIAEVNFRLHPVAECVRTWTFSLAGATADAAAFSDPLRALRDSYLTPSSVQIRASKQAGALDIRFAGAPVRLDEYALRIQEIFSRFASVESNHDVWTARQQLFDKRDSLLLKISALPNEVCALCAELQQCPDIAIVAQAHGIITAALPPDHASSWVERLRTRMSRSAGNVAALRLPESLRGDIDVWGPGPGALPLMQEIKRRFDPSRVLNPGRLWGNL